jgi:hypothetical protein
MKMDNQILIDILREMENYRLGIENGRFSAGHPGHTIRVCQAYVAERAGFTCRAD